MTDFRVENRAARRRAAHEHARQLAPAAPRNPLGALTAAALALPGMAGPALADAPAPDPTVAYAFSFYKEANLAPALVSAGSNERYEIFTHQLSMTTPVADRIELGADFIVESMSGATPWFVSPDPAGGPPQQAMTAATVSENRFDGNAHGSFYFDDARLGANLGGSVENDYWSIYFGGNGEHHLNDKNTTLSGGLSASFDTIEPTDGGTDGRVVRENKQSVAAFAGLSQIMGRRTAMQTTLNYKYSTGFLSDPYKKAWIGSALAGVTVPDARPDTRHQIAWLTRFRRHYEGPGASLHFDYRYTWDSWEITTHTFDVQWHQNLFDDLVQVIPSVRYYSQGQAFFYAPTYPQARPDGLASSDYRLSPFGAITAGLRAQLNVSDWPGNLDWRFALHYQRYWSSADFALGTVAVANPGLVDYHLAFFTIDLPF